MKQLGKLTAVIILFIFSPFSIRACICTDYLTMDSLPQLKEYDFIALVKITDDQDFKETIGLLTINILELFKGQRIDKMLEYEKHSSCDIGISKGEEWILFGKRINGKMAIFACDRNVQYKEKNELRDWKYGRGMHELKQLRKLYEHAQETFGNTKRTEFYSNGQIEIEETYANGKINGERKIWYPNGILFCKEFYINDTLDGKAEWFYPSGQIYDEDFYQRGAHCNVSRLYYDSSIDQNSKEGLIETFYKTEDSLNFVFRRIQPQYEIVFDSYGWSILSREYNRAGKIIKEETFDHARKFRTIIYYHENGTIQSVGYSLNENNFGHYQTYNEKGFPDRGWDYDENGKVIKQKK